MMRSAGLFDLQVNGYAGIDFNDPGVTGRDMDHAFEAMRVAGVTGCLPTIITATRAEIAARLTALDAAVAASQLGRAMVPGYHLEGPFLNDGEGYHGCHPPSAMQDPDAGFIADLDAALKRPVMLVTLAPERPGGVAATARLAAMGKVVAIGHSAAGHDTVEAAVEAGAALSTHLGNGLPAQLPKLENTLLAQLAQPSLHACLIADGHHMSPQALAALIRLKGPERCVLVTDAVAAAGAAPGRHPFAGMQVTLGPDGKVTQPGAHGLAGSALCLDQAVRNVVTWKIVSPVEAVAMAGDRPRRAMARAFARAGLCPDPGSVEWTPDLKPRLINAGNMTG
ncbi:hypothetical protein [Paracoccus sp. (in: a-proteobacteria)]|uniref:hypothetical protein n=1 Tax=Paracoccus sp. TaxID=267 RepID=UPI003A8B65DC